MSLWLKQSTSVVVQFGPFLDKTNGVALEVGLAAALDNATTGIRVSKNGGTLADRNSSTAPTYDAMGLYKVTLDTTDTNTLGTLKIIFEEAATCLPVWQEFMVVPANVWDSLFGADALDVNVAQWLGTAAATPTVAGVPEVDVTHMAGGVQTVTDLKDFADAGYDPVTNKVEGVKTVDTNTDMRGTDSAALASVCTAARLAELDAANLPADNANIKADTAAILTDTADMQPKVGAPAADLAADIAAVKADTAATLVDTTVIGAAGAGLTALAQAAVCTEARLAELAAANLPADIDQIKADLPTKIVKNVAISNFMFLMVDSTDGRTPKPGLTVTATRSINGAAFAAAANSVTEIAFGMYKINLATTDLNGDTITLKFTAAGADDRLISIVTQAT